MRRFVLVVLLLISAASVGSAADRTITQKEVTENHIDRLTIEAAAGAGPGDRVITLAATYHVVNAAGKQIGGQRWINVPLTPGQITTLRNFITNVVRPAVIAEESK